MNIDTSFAADVVDNARKRGATAVEVIVRDEIEFSLTVRLGEIETLTQSASKALGIRVLVDGRQASVSSSDFSPDGISTILDEVLAMARATSIDESSDLPDPGQFASDVPDLEIYDQKIADLSADAKIEMALACEQAARDSDSRIVNFDRGGLGTTVGTTILANSMGFSGQYRSTSISLAAVPVAEQDGKMQRDYWFDVKRSLADMSDPALIGRKAAARALRKLGARKATTCQVPIVLEGYIARDFASTLFQAVSGEAIFRKASLFADRLGERIAIPSFTVVDDGRQLKGLGSRPFDGEGLPTRRTVVVNEGVLESFLLNTYTGRKLGKASTGNAVRGITGPASVGPGNLYIQPGSESLEDIIGSIKNGLLVTEMMGFGVNIVNGDYSRGAAGIWIENGELTYPVEEITIAGNIKDMLLGIETIGADLEFLGRTASPSILIGKMSVSGN